MELNKLEKYKKQFKYFTNQIDSLKTYLHKVSDRHIVVINPDAVSNALSIPVFDAIFLLSLAEKENLLHKKFHVFTKNEHNPLGEYDSSSAIPQTIVDDETGEEIYKDNYYIDIVFELA